MARAAGGGIEALSAAEGLALLDAALARDEALLVPVRLDLARLRARAARDSAEVPALWRGLVRGRPKSAAVGQAGSGSDESDALRRQLAGLSAADRDRVLLELVQGHAAAVLGHASPEAIEPGRAFSEIGFDSLTAVELRNRLQAASGLRLSSTLVFDFPDPAGAGPPYRCRPDRNATARDRKHQRRWRRGSRWRSWRWPVGSRAGQMIPMGCGGCWPRTGTRSRGSRPTAAGIWTVHQQCQLSGPAGSSVRRVILIRGFSESARGRHWRWTRSSGCCWRCAGKLSSGRGIDPVSLRGSKTGVFVGAWSQGYRPGPEGGAGSVDGYQMVGDAPSVISGRVSYTLGLEGPAVTVDTACSSALVALHLAGQALRAGECDLALAGGVTVMATPHMLGVGQQLGLAADGRCKAFSSAADGMGVAEGTGVLVLERLCDARRHGHPVLAVVAGSAVNQDGASNGLTAPNGLSQQRVIRAALASAGLSADQVDAVEAHGTGTVLGDPIEAQALIATYGQDRPADRPLWLDSVKSNIGHAQAAAGVAGVMKMVLALHHQMLPRTLHVDEPSSHVDWSAGAVSLLTQVPWPGRGPPRRAGISSFGISGTNVHAIIEEAPASQDGLPAGESQPSGAVVTPVLTADVVPWVVSGRTSEGLARQAVRLAGFVVAHPESRPVDVGWSLAANRSQFGYRTVVIGADREELAAGLDAVTADVPASGVTGTAPIGGGGRVVFVFPGQGTQWAGMARELAACSPVFASRLDECGRALARHVDWPLDYLLAQADDMPEPERADVIQPALWAVMVSLAATWQAAGITPDAVVGHSQGEIAAACVAGILSLEDAAKVVAVRSRALSGLAVKGDGAAAGGMISVVMPAASVSDLLVPWAGRLSVAAVNGPTATVVSGELAALAEFEAELSARRVMRWRIPATDFVPHSPQVTEMAGMLAGLADVRPAAGRIPLYSTVMDRWMEGPELDAGYWYANVRQTVKFEHAIRALAANYRFFIEVSPHPVLTTAIQETIEDTGAAAVPVITGTLLREDGGARRLLSSFAQVYVHGGAVDWAGMLRQAGGQRVDLPTYAFENQRYWPKPPAAPKGDVTSAGLDPAGHPLLGAAVPVAADGGLLLTGQLSLRSHTWLADHRWRGPCCCQGRRSWSWRSGRDIRPGAAGWRS